MSILGKIVDHEVSQGVATTTYADEPVALQPDTREVLQAEPEPLMTVPVCVKDVEGPVRTQALPRKSASTMTKSVGTTAVRVLSADKHRASATLISTGDDMLIGFSQNSMQATSSAAFWPKGVPYTCTAAVEVWVQANATTAQVSVIAERWATG